MHRVVEVGFSEQPDDPSVLILVKCDQDRAEVSGSWHVGFPGELFGERQYCRSCRGHFRPSFAVVLEECAPAAGSIPA